MQRYVSAEWFWLITTHTDVATGQSLAKKLKTVEATRGQTITDNAFSLFLEMRHAVFNAITFIINKRELGTNCTPQ